MTGVEIANYLKTKCKNKDIMVDFLEDTLKINLGWAMVDSEIGSRYNGCFYTYKDEFITEVGTRDRATIVTGLWKFLNDKQKQKLIDTVKDMQSRDVAKSKC